MLAQKTEKKITKGGILQKLVVALLCVSTLICSLPIYAYGGDAEYSVSTQVSPDGDAEIVLSRDKAKASDNVSFIIECSENHSIKKVWTTPETEISVFDSGIYSFAMPDSDVTVHAEITAGVSVGDFVLASAEALVEGTDYSFADGRLVISSEKNILIKNEHPETPTENYIYIPSGVSANLTLCGVNIHTKEYGAPAIFIADGSDGTVKITLEDGTKNVLYSENDSAIRKKGDAGTLIICGDGYLDARIGVSFYPVIGAVGTVSKQETVSNIYINGGHIYIGTLTERDESNLAYTGIGGGYNACASDIFINGGVITVEGFENAVGGGMTPYVKYAGSDNIVFSKEASIKVSSMKDAIPVGFDGSSEPVILCAELNFGLSDGITLEIDGTPLGHIRHDDGVNTPESRIYVYLTAASETNPHEVTVSGRMSNHFYFDGASGEWSNADGNFQLPIRFAESNLVIALADYNIVPYETGLRNNNIGATVKYTSDNISVATVNGDGELYAVSAGTAKITAVSSKSGCPDVSATFTVRILENHTVQCLPGMHGEISAEPQSAIEGTEIVISSEPDDGYICYKYEVTGKTSGNTYPVNDGSFIMPDEDVTVEGFFASALINIAVIQDGEGRGIVTAPKIAASGETVYVTAYSAESYELISFDVVDKADSLIYTNVFTGYFIVPDSAPENSIYIVPAFAPKRYTINKQTDGHGTITVNEDMYFAVKGESVPFSVSPEADYELSEISVKDKDGNIVSLTDYGSYAYKFTMPASDVTISASFKRESHDIIIETAKLSDGSENTGGSVTPSKTAAVCGETVTLTVAAESGYVLSYLNITGGAEITEISATEYTFEMSEDDVLVKAAFAPATEQGTQGNPWKIGTAANPGGIIAYVAGDNVLYIGKSGAGDARMADFEPGYTPYHSRTYDINEVVVCEGVTNVGTYTIYNRIGFLNMTKLTLPSSLKELGEHAVSGCERLASITIPASVEQIGAYCFDGDYLLHTVIFEGVPDFSKVDENAFAGVNADVYVPISWLTDGKFDPDAYQFGGKLNYVIVGTESQHSITVVESEYGDVIPDKNVHAAGETVKVTLKNSYEGFGYYVDRVFLDPYVQYTVSSIDGGMEITFTMPDCDMKIHATFEQPGYDTRPWLVGLEQQSGPWVYKNTDVLAWCDTDPDDITKKILYICPQKSGASMTSFEIGARPWERYANVISSIVVIEKDGNHLEGISENAFAGFTALKKADLGTNTRGINAGAFADCTSLEYVTMPAVKVIGANAFSGCSSLVSFEAPFVNAIDQKAFYGCTSLVGNTIDMHDMPMLSLPYVSDVCEDAFAHCDSLTTVKIGKDGGEAGTVHARAFEECSSLKEVILDVSVKVIDENAFKNCPSL
ncbi:MAG: leucine-rich repeat protein, partial [Clostridiales bacterium]|nr:leucine-rich repeat protein [Clostridiales bacterium]